MKSGKPRHRQGSCPRRQSWNSQNDSEGGYYFDEGKDSRFSQLRIPGQYRNPKSRNKSCDRGYNMLSFSRDNVLHSSVGSLLDYKADHQKGYKQRPFRKTYWERQQFRDNSYSRCTGDSLYNIKKQQKNQRFQTKETGESKSQSSQFHSKIQGEKILFRRFLHDCEKVSDQGERNVDHDDDDDDDNDDASLFDSECGTRGSASDSGWSQEEENEDDFLSLSDQSDGLSSNSSNNRRKKYNRRSLELPKIGVYWDIENCRIPKGKSVRAFVKRVRDAFYEGFQEEEFVVVCDVSRESKEILTELSNSQVEIEHVMSESKNAADEKLRERMRLFSENAEAQSRVVLITSDINFSSDLRNLRYRKNIDVILIHSKMVNSALTDFANENIIFEDFLNDLPSKTLQMQAPNKLLIKNLPSYAPTRRLIQQLNKLFNNCGGKFLKVVEDELQQKAFVMKFPSSGDASRALNRFNGYEIYGRQIQIESFQELHGLMDKVNAFSITSQKQVLNYEDIELRTYWVLINGDKTVNEENLKQSLSKIKLPYISFEFTRDIIGRCRCCIEYPSKNQAENIVKALKNEFGSRINANIINNANAASPSQFQKHQNPETERLIQQMITIRNHHIELHNKAKREMINQVKVMKDDEARLMQSNISLMDIYLDEFHRTFRNLLAKLNDSSANHRSIMNALDIECRRFNQPLRIYAYKERIIKAWKKERVTIITGPPGIGKSTEILQYLLEESESVNGQIAVIEPYNICAVFHANAVAKQYCSSVDDLVGCKVFSKSKMQLRSKAIYITDRLFLSEYSEDRELKNYSCIIIDEIQERSDYTEVLLPLMRTLIKSRGDLKLVLISANEDVSCLMQFFSPCIKISVPQRMIPVQVIWQPKIKASTYTELVVRNIQQILNEFQTGDVLAFLPNASEVLLAETLLKQQKQKSGLIIKSLYSEMLINEANFNMIQNNDRRVILATSICQNALSLKNIQFVIDCGVRKEVQGNCISTTFISKREAEWRMMRVDTKAGGRCYRLYSEKDLEAKSLKDIEWNPEYDKLILLLLKLGFSLFPEFPFVHKIDKEELVLSWRELEEINAIQFGNLTEKGHLMAVLNMCPRLAILIAETLQDNNLCCIIISLVAVMSLNIIYPSEVTKQGKNYKSFETNSHVFTLTTSFLQWFYQKDREKHKWCVNHNVDRNLMEQIQHNVLEIQAIITNATGKVIPFVRVNTDCYIGIQEVLLKCWRNNLSCLQNPLTKAYLCLKTGKTVFPLSTNYFCPHSKYVIFDKTVDDEEGNSYMLHTISLDEALVKKAAKDPDFDIDISSPKLHDVMICTIRPIGNSILRNFVRKTVNPLIAEMKHLLGSKNISIQGFSKAGKILIKAQDKAHLSLIQRKVENILQQEQDLLLQESFEYDFDKIIGLRVQIRASGRINNLLFPQNSSIILVDVTGIEDISAVIDEFKQFGNISYNIIKSKTDAVVQLKVQFDSRDQAKAAIISKFPYKISAYPSVSNQEPEINSEFEMLVTWPRRKNKGKAILNFGMIEGRIYLALQALLHQTMKSSIIEKCSLQADPSSNRITVNDLNPLITKEELTSFTRSTCWKARVSLKNIEMPLEPSFTTSQEDLKTICNKLLAVVKQFVDQHSVKVNILNPQEKDDLWKAILVFEDPQVASFIMQNLNQGTEFDGIPLKARASATIHCTNDVFKFIEKPLSDSLNDINAETAEMGNELNISFDCDSDGQNVRITINAIDLTDFIHNCYHVSELIHGEKIAVRELQMHFFKEKLEGRAMIKELRKSEDVLIEVDVFSKCLYLWGDSQNVRNAKDKLENFISQRHQSKSFYYGNAPGFLSSISEKFGSNFFKLNNETGCRIVDVNVNQYTLQVYGSEDSVQKAILKLNELKRKFLEDLSKSETVTVDVCPVCLGNDVTSRRYYRLEYCGHAYCFPCIAVILANGKMPLTCSRQDCKKPFVNLDFCTFSKEFKPLLDELLNMEIKQFVQSNHHKMMLCPVPICEGILEVSPNKKTVFCAVCGNAICTSCQTMYHYGQTCTTFKEFKPHWKK